MNLINFWWKTTEYWVYGHKSLFVDLFKHFNCYFIKLFIKIYHFEENKAFLKRPKKICPKLAKSGQLFYERSFSTSLQKCLKTLKMDCKLRKKSTENIPKRLFYNKNMTWFDIYKPFNSFLSFEKCHKIRQKVSVLFPGKWKSLKLNHF